MSDDDQPIKSAYELAMERLSKEQGEIKTLTDDQKQRLAELTQHYKAKRVERELAIKPMIDEALAKGELGEADRLRDQLAAEIAEFDAEETAKKESIRDEGAG